MTDPKLPDPFTKMDGTPMTDRSEWLCRRQEILEETHAFIYGKKPVPEEGSVSGSVSSSSITVSAEGPEGTAMFTVSVNMNGATGPAPAIIGYGGVNPIPVPSGIAILNFTPVETSGGSGPKSGPFYDAYGSDHEAGILIAQAWQVSRLIDVLEQNPGTIDPYHLGVTGCSRNGKGAFVAGVLDNRIALTMPIESGIGGTVAMRLVHGLDSGANTEYPYHTISYVRWMSEIALGQFTTSNDESGDQTDDLPVDMHELMAVIAPRGLFIMDNPSTTYNGLDRNSAWVTANVGKMAFEALGVGDHLTYAGASGSHCAEWRTPYVAPFAAMVDKFLKGNDAASTGTVTTDLSNPPDPLDHIDWTAPTLTGEL